MINHDNYIYNKGNMKETYLKINGELYDAYIVSSDHLDSRHLLTLEISGDRQTLHDLLTYEKNGSCRVDWREYSVLAVLLMLTNTTIGPGMGAKTNSRISIAWTS